MKTPKIIMWKTSNGVRKVTIILMAVELNEWQKVNLKKYINTLWMANLLKFGIPQENVEMRVIHKGTLQLVVGARETNIRAINGLINHYNPFFVYVFSSLSSTSSSVFPSPSGGVVVGNVV